ncbi:MAG: HAMP domain-containing histidine kinase [Lachnospiraceae bacterium]|nr:HAMP domain-containing histidine kinase [Lachnospiraceae bacterium]
MKFSYKILLCSIMILAAAFGFGGFFFVNYVFETSMDREIGQAMDDSSILKFALETAALNIPSKYDVLQDSTIEEIGANLENSQNSSLLRISDENFQLLYASDGFVEETELLAAMEEQSRIYQVIHTNDHYYIQTGTVISAMDRMLYLETMKDVTDVFEERSQGFLVYRRLTIILLLCGSIAMYFISYWLTKPIRLLAKATRQMTEGDYGYRAEEVSRDEMGQLTRDFNRMSGVLEKTIRQLEDEVRAREDFIAAFSHELKTPLTAIIGYADVLRSRKLDEETHFMSANYIYTEGKRLEAMSLRLLDIIVTKRYELDAQQMDVELLFGYLREMYIGKEDIRLEFQYEQGSVFGELDLIKTVLLNLVDNACKASEPGSTVEIYGEKKEQGYYFAVKDYGTGIPAEECKKIMEAFYMVDKSRSRSKNGAGLGLALCTEILKLHGSELTVESTLGEGSCFGFILQYEEVKVHEETKH